MGTRQLKGQRKQCTITALNAGNNNMTNNHNNNNTYVHNNNMDFRRTQPVGQMNMTQPNSRFYHNFNHSLGFPGMERNMNSSVSPTTRSPQINNESDSINTYIEKLCLRMTEQALGGAMG